MGSEPPADSVAGMGVAIESKPVMVNVANGKEGMLLPGSGGGAKQAAVKKTTSSLWNVPNMLTMARVVAIPVRE